MEMNEMTLVQFASFCLPLSMNFFIIRIQTRFFPKTLRLAKIAKRCLVCMIFLFAQSLSCFIKTIRPETKSSDGNLPFWLAQPILDCLDHFEPIQFRSIKRLVNRLAFLSSSNSRARVPWRTLGKTLNF